MLSSALRVGISGSYGGFNLGDEAILTAILGELQGSGPLDITVFSRNAEQTLRRHRVARALQLSALSRGEARQAIAQLDLFILGGGGILFDGDAGMYLRQVELAHELEVPVMVYAIGAGPLVDAALRARVREALAPSAAITVRDRHTRELLEEIGIQRELVLSADPALLLEPERRAREDALRAEAIDPAARLIGFSVREPGPAAPQLDTERYHHLLANAADFVADRLDADVVFVPMEHSGLDVQLSHAVVGRMRHARRATVLKHEYGPERIIGLLEHFSFAIGMRLHFLIFAALAGLPFAGLAYAPKVSGFLDELHQPAPAFQAMSVGQLIAYIDREWDRRESISERVRAMLPALQDRARLNGSIARRLLRHARAKRERLASTASVREPERRR